MTSSPDRSRQDDVPARRRSARATAPSLWARVCRRLDRLRHPEARLCFAQEAEELVLLRTLRLPAGRVPFYVDVGAHDPKWYSNTMILYQSGWRGLNIDATPGVADRFRKSRPDDISLELAVGTGETIEFIDFADHAVSGLSGPAAEAAQANGSRIKGRRTVTTTPLSEIFTRHLTPGQPIDLLSIDVEGHESDVLKSNDWTRFRPTVVMAEVGGAVALDEVESSLTTVLLRGHGYIPYAKTGLTVLFAAAASVRRGPHCFEVVL